MTDILLQPIATCLETGVTVKAQDLTGAQFAKNFKLQRKWAMEAAERLAAKQRARTELTWTAGVREYTGGINRL